VTAPGFNVSHLERTYNSPVVRAQRTRIRELLDPAEGDVVVDLGCGPGHLAAELAQDVGPRGHVVALDREAGMLDAARAKLVQGNSELVLGDVTAVPLEDGRCDGAVVVQVLEYVPDVAAALGEVRRVLRPGGVAVLVDTDWRSAVWHTEDRQRTDAVLRHWEGHFEHPHLPTAMPRLARSAGFATADVTALPMVETATVGDTYSLGMAATIAHFVARTDPDLAKEWRDDVRTQAKEGRYFFSLNRFATVVAV
jgi:arsenite methyltransferase